MSWTFFRLQDNPGASSVEPLDPDESGGPPTKKRRSASGSETSDSSKPPPMAKCPKCDFRCFSSKELAEHSSVCFTKSASGFSDSARPDPLPFQANPHPGPANPFMPDYYHSRPDPYPFHQSHFYNPYSLYQQSFPPPAQPSQHPDWSPFPVDLHASGSRTQRCHQCDFETGSTTEMTKHVMLNHSYPQQQQQPQQQQ